MCKKCKAGTIFLTENIVPLKPYKPYDMIILLQYLI